MRRYKQWRARRQMRAEMADAAIQFHNEWFCWSVMVSGCETPESENAKFDHFQRRFMDRIDAAYTAWRAATNPEVDRGGDQ